MAKTRLTLLLFIALLSNTKAQTLWPENTDSFTYVCFTQQRYNELWSSGKAAIQEGNDFYYLRIRMAYAYFYAGNYEAAIPHLSRALEMNATDPEVMQTLYYSFVYTGQSHRAYAIAKEHPEALALTVLNAPGRWVIEAEVGRLTTPNATDHETVELRTNGGNYADGNFFSVMDYGRIYAEGILKPRNKLMLGANVFQNNHLSRMLFFGKQQNSPNQNNNYQINAAYTHLFDKGFSLSAGLGFYRQNFTYLYLNSTLPVPPPTTDFASATVSNSALSASLQLNKRIKHADLGVAIHTSNIDGIRRYQQDFGFTLFPLGSAKLYLHTAIAHLSDTVDRGINYHQTLGYVFNRKFSAEAMVQTGYLDNHIGNLGFLMMNAFDPIQAVYGIQLRMQAGSRLAFQTGYRYQQRETSYVYENAPGVSVLKTYTYAAQLLFLSIQWML